MTTDSDLGLYIVALLAVGVFSGFAGGFFGIGGGLLRVPIFLYLFPKMGVDPGNVFHLAAGTSLALAVPTCIASTWRQAKEKNLDAALLKVWVPGLLVGIGVGLIISRWSSGKSLQSLFAVVMFLQAIDFLLPKRPQVSNRLPGVPGLLGLSSGIGMLSAALGLSGGVFTSTALLAFGQSIHKTVAVASAGGVVISIVAAAGMIVSGIDSSHSAAYSLGYVNLPALFVVAPVVLWSSPLGVRFSNRMPARRLELSMGYFLILLAGIVFFEALGIL